MESTRPGAWRGRDSRVATTAMRSHSVASSRLVAHAVLLYSGREWPRKPLPQRQQPRQWRGPPYGSSLWTRTRCSQVCTITAPVSPAHSRRLSLILARIPRRNFSAARPAHGTVEQHSRPDYAMESSFLATSMPCLLSELSRQLRRRKLPRPVNTTR